MAKGRELTFQEFCKLIDALSLQTVERKTLQEVLGICAAVARDPKPAAPFGTAMEAVDCADALVKFSSEQFRQSGRYSGWGYAERDLRELWHRYERARDQA